MAKAWIALVVLVAAFVAIANWSNRMPTEQQRVPVPIPENIKKPRPRKATLEPGRVVKLDTVKGTIEFVLLEKDCPVSTKRIADLVSNGGFDNVAFPRVESGLIQTDEPKVKTSPVKLEVCKGLENVKGAVGMARRGNDLNSGNGVFYVLIEPWRHLDYEYCVFGRVIRGIDVADKIVKGDKIRKATLHPLTPEDRKLFMKALKEEVDRENS